ncbi:unnamed protein product, partial [Musa textilis]
CISTGLHCWRTNDKQTLTHFFSLLKELFKILKQKMILLHQVSFLFIKAFPPFFP